MSGICGPILHEAYYKVIIFMIDVISLLEMKK